MADVASALRSWSSTASSNAPSGATVIGSGLDDNLRQIQATVRQYLASKGTNMASGATVDLSTADGFFVDITGTTTITALGTESAGVSYLLRFNGALTLTHNATSLICPGGASILTASGDMCLAVSLGSGNWQIAWYSVSGGTSATPTGAVIPYAGTAAPTGWLLCFGQAVSRTTYAGLFAIVSTTYGIGDGSTTFNLPDLRGRVAAGKDDMGGTAASRLTNSASGGVTGSGLGNSGGEQAHTLTTAEIPAHTHSLDGQTPVGSTPTSPSALTDTNTRNVGTATGSAGGGGAHNVVQPTIVLNYLIKT